MQIIEISYRELANTGDYNNIAVEMPESEVDGTHYRVLFLAALVLFMFTFIFNTLAEVIRQRLREKYSSL